MFKYHEESDRLLKKPIQTNKTKKTKPKQTQTKKNPQPKFLKTHVKDCP